MTEPAIEVCPECKGKTRRLISGGAGLLFKGSGFYQTDYRSARYKADQSRDSAASSPPPAADSSKKSETKSDKK